ncbi:hypothetical protein L596_002775 [Steinernema carpocapsae]|uniref:Uncharacterized protein n=1 Tax=Steinernema carpocapsae TaxID=34508 RepID=A0A4U8UR43_STECR|nr:hypothetical protein L596_002775 [Steinernema carpocapsae]
MTRNPRTHCLKRSIFEIGFLCDNGVPDQQSRRATCPEIWLNSEEPHPEIEKYILRVYGDHTVGKKTMAEKLALQASVDCDQQQFTSSDDLTSSSRTISFLINNGEVQLEIIQGSALESNPFQNVLTIYVVMYSIDSRESFVHAAQMLYRINDNKAKGEGPPIILVANKIDLQRKRRVSFLGNQKERKAVQEVNSVNYRRKDAL